MSDNSLSQIRIKHLEGAEGYDTWKTKMTHLLIHMDLDSYIKDDPPEGTPSEKATWEHKQMKALGQIFFRVGEKPMAHIKNMKTAKAAWEKLQRIYETRGITAIIRLRRRLSQTTCTEGEDVENYLHTLTQIRSDIETYGSTIDDKEFAITLLAGLPESWDSFIGTFQISALPDTDEIIARIITQNSLTRARPEAADTALPAFHRKNHHFSSRSHSGSKPSNWRLPEQAQGKKLH
jgi:hypothetical protein